MRHVSSRIVFDITNVQYNGSEISITEGLPANGVDPILVTKAAN